VFDVQGPSGSSYPTQIVRSALTDQTGAANVTFRIPLNTNEKPVFGTWQIYTNAKTAQGTIQQNATFQVGWPIQVNSINLVNAKGQNETTFKQGDTVTALLSLSSNQAEEANITLNAQDAARNEVAQTQLQNVAVNKTSGIVKCNFKIPSTATLGQATINVMISSGTYQNTIIQASENETANFTIAAATPTPPPAIQNTVSLFSWLLVATAFFTFTSLVLFLRRKPQTTEATTTPNLPPEVAGPTGGAPSALQQTITGTSQTFIAMPEKAGEPAAKYSSVQELLEAQVLDQLNEIAAIVNRIEALKAELKLEKENLSKGLDGLNRTVEEQNKETKGYFDAIRAEIAKLEELLAEKERETGKNEDTSQFLNRAKQSEPKDDENAEKKDNAENEKHRE
jgi:hypothetical protein